MLARALILSVSMMLCGAAAHAQGITQQQADEILKELRAMRVALEKLAAQQPQPARAPSAAAPTAAQSAGNNPVKLADAGGYALGKADAPLTMVEFTDLQCPFCNRFSTTTFDEIKKAYIDTGLLRFVSRDFPLTNLHPHAMRAAMASRCAGEQGKYWEMRSTLVKNGAALSPQLMTSTAKDLGLDVAAFDACVDSGRFEADIQKDVQAAQGVGIGGTPSFVVGRTVANGLEGVRLTGAQPFAVFDAKLKELLAAKPPTR